MTDVLLVERADGVATVTLNRPESMNSLSVELKQALVTELDAVARDESVRAVVLTGNGRGFCVGQDLREHVAALETGDVAPLSTVVEHYNPIVMSLATMPKPVIAAVNGMAAGAGAGFAFACDFRIASSSAGFLIAFANVGLSLDSGVSWTLPRLIGSARATALCLLAEPITADAAFEMGLVNALVDPDRVLPAAHELAARLAAGPDRRVRRDQALPRRRRDVRPRDGPRHRGRAADRDGSDRGPPQRHRRLRRQAEARLHRPLRYHPRRPSPAPSRVVRNLSEWCDISHHSRDSAPLARSGAAAVGARRD